MIKITVNLKPWSVEDRNAFLSDMVDCGIDFEKKDYKVIFKDLSPNSYEYVTMMIGK